MYSKEGLNNRKCFLSPPSLFGKSCSNKKKSLYMIIILFLSVLTGSPWDWQSMNAKYPSDHSRSNLPAYGSTKPFPEIMPVNANVSVFESHTALLPCRIKQLQEYTVNLGNDFYEYIYMLGCMYKNRVRYILAECF